MLRLPDFPWDSLAPTKERASAFSDPSLGAAGEGLVDLSVGTPVDPTPAVVREALAEASDAHGYPLTWGTADLREAVGDLVRRPSRGARRRPRRGAADDRLQGARRLAAAAAGARPG